MQVGQFVSVEMRRMQFQWATGPAVIQYMLATGK